MDEAHNKLLERLRTYYGDDLACRTLLMDARHALEALAGDRDRTRADYETMKAHNKELFGKLSAAELERDRLKAALAPFAAIKADDGDDFSTYDDQVVIRCEVTAGDLRKARKALGGAS